MSFDFASSGRQAPVSAADPNSASGGASDHSGGKQRTSGKYGMRDGVPCRCCSEACAIGSPYCWRHKRAFGRLVKQAMRGKKQGTELYQQYVSIFGEGRAAPPDPGLAIKVVRDLADAFGEDNNDDNTSAGAAKALARSQGSINLSQYIHSRGARASSEVVQCKYMYDYELFLHKMKTVRSWPAARCHQEFQRLAADPMVKKDQKGQPDPTFGTLRCAIPPGLVGEDKEEERYGTFEERALETTTKSKRMDEEEQRLWLDSTSSGFTYNLNMSKQPDVVTSMQTPLAPDSVAQEFDFQAKIAEIVERNIAKDAGDFCLDAEAKSDITSVVGGVVGVKRPLEVVSLGSEVSPAKRYPMAPAASLASARSALWATVRDGIAGLKAKLHSEMSLAALAIHASEVGVHGGVFISTVQQRLAICENFLGKTYKVNLAESVAGGEAGGSTAMPIVVDDIKYLGLGSTCAIHLYFSGVEGRWA